MPFPLLFVLLLTFFACSCMDPAQPRSVPDDLDRSLALMGLLDPFAPGVVVLTTDIRDTTLMGAEATLEGSDGTVLRGQRAARCEGFPTLAIPSGWACFQFHMTLQPQVEYEITAAADGYEPAGGAATMPGNFVITAHSAQGDPPGSEWLEVEWSPSTGAYRYLVAIRATDTPGFGCSRGCGWWMATPDTRFEGLIPDEAYRNGEGPWYVDVYAVERNLFNHMSSGSPGDLFAVAPSSNVWGGHGVVGAWVRRSVQLGP